jgi:murein DD-endopeptidase MepM/ murein hydrolase activator NlpD
MRPIIRTTLSTGESRPSAASTPLGGTSRSSAIRLPLAKCLLRCDRYLRLISGGTYGLTRFEADGKTRKFHGGIDLFATVGTDCYAIADGVVEWADDRSATWGNAVLLRVTVAQQPLWVLYAHLSKILVTIGDVAKGAVVGRTGISGTLSDASYPHLHFEVWTSLKAGQKGTHDRYRLNPLDVLGPLPYEPFAVEVVERLQRA